MLTSRYRELERVTKVAPFGVRFYDSATGAFPADLAVTLHRAGWPPIALFSGPSGVYAARDLPGLSVFENAADYKAAWDAWNALPPRSPAAAEPYRLAVVDPFDRFLSFSLPISAPHRGLLTLLTPLAGLAVPPGAVPLFSAATRAAPAGQAEVRADLCELRACEDAAGNRANAQREAARAIVTLRYEGNVLGRGIADERGRALVVFPYPRPDVGVPGAGGPPFAHEWPVTLEVHYAPETPMLEAGALPPCPDRSPAAPWKADDLPPDLSLILQQLDRPPATALLTCAGASFTQFNLRYGASRRLNTREAGRDLSSLFITPA